VAGGGQPRPSRAEGVQCPRVEMHAAAVSSRREVRGAEESFGRSRRAGVAVLLIVRSNVRFASARAFIVHFIQKRPRRGAAA